MALSLHAYPLAVRPHTAGVCYDVGDQEMLQRALGELQESSHRLVNTGEILLAARLLNDQAATELGTGYSLVGKVTTMLMQVSVTNTAQGTITATIQRIFRKLWAFAPIPSSEMQTPNRSRTITRSKRWRIR